ncbi:MAG: hypothetical protein MUE51_01475 [Thermoleophilia bacterium]|nr:hypothetical protein [Thermoleophilia bacterium]
MSTPAAEVLDLRIVRPDPPRADRRALAGLYLGFGRKAPPAAAVAVFEVATGRVLVVVPAEDGGGAAQGLLHVMRADLDRLDADAFLRRWARMGPRR